MELLRVATVDGVGRLIGHVPAGGEAADRIRAVKLNNGRNCVEDRRSDCPVSLDDRAARYQFNGAAVCGGKPARRTTIADLDSAIGEQEDVSAGGDGLAGNGQRGRLCDAQCILGPQ
jgi:hypothetical protein